MVYFTFSMIINTTFGLFLMSFAMFGFFNLGAFFEEDPIVGIEKFFEKIDQNYFNLNRKKVESSEFLAENENKDEYEYTDEEIAELLENLDPLAYHVVSGGTEEPFNNAYWDNKADGIYVDIVTGKPLFSSTHKYDSGTGWPSFWRSIDDDSIILKEDNSLGMKRTEIRSDTSHLGHVFDDGPIEEGGRRFCTNSASLRFVPKEEMVDEGYEEYLHLFDFGT